MTELPAWAGELIAAAGAAGEDAGAGLQLAAEYGSRLPQPGQGGTAERWSVLAAVGRVDLTPARILEAHSDALAILGEAELAAAPGTWGVFAAEAPNARLDGTTGSDGWRLAGRKPWCSLANQLDHALVTAHVPGGRQLFAVDLRQAGVSAEPDAGWVARGLRAIPSCAVDFADVPAQPVGDRDWYLTRPGFAWGGIGVAACWAGGADGLLDRLRAARRADPIADLQLGIADTAAFTAHAVLADAARCVDAGEATGQAGAVLALRARSAVAAAAERILEIAAHALGPAPLAFDETYARRTADLQLYLRQHHAERDLAALGTAVRA